MKSGFKAVIAIAGIAFAVLVVVRVVQVNLRAGEVREQGREMERVFDEYAANLTMGRLQAAYAMGGRSFKEATSYAAFNAGLANLQRDHGSLRKIARLQSRMTGSGEAALVGHVKAQYEFQTGSTTVMHEFRRESDNWVLYAFKINWADP